MAAKKTSAKKTKTSKKKVQNTNSFEKLLNDAKDVLYASLGAYGKILDEVNARMDTARNDRSRNWQELVARGEKLHKDLNEKVKSFDGEVTFDVPVYVDVDEFRSSMKEMRSNLEEKIEELKARLQPFGSEA